jgi:hypothetical protein
VVALDYATVRGGNPITLLESRQRAPTLVAATL